MIEIISEEHKNKIVDQIINKCTTRNSNRAKYICDIIWFAHRVLILTPNRIDELFAVFIDNNYSLQSIYFKMYLEYFERYSEHEAEDLSAEDLQAIQSAWEQFMKKQR